MVRYSRLMSSYRQFWGGAIGMRSCYPRQHFLASVHRFPPCSAAHQSRNVCCGGRAKSRASVHCLASVQWHLADHACACVRGSGPAVRYAAQASSASDYSSTHAAALIADASALGTRCSSAYVSVCLARRCTKISGMLILVGQTS